MVFGGGSKHKDKDQDKQRHSPSPTSQQQQQQQQQSDYSWLSPSEREAAERARTDKERQDYLASLDQRRGAHVAGATPTSSYDAYGRGRYEEEGEDVPTAPKMVSPDLKNRLSVVIEWFGSLCCWCWWCWGWAK